MKCDTCGKEATYFGINPYLEEMFPGEEHEKEWFCDECYQENIRDI